MKPTFLEKLALMAYVCIMIFGIFFAVIFLLHLIFLKFRIYEIHIG